MRRLVGLRFGGRPGPWERLGFAFTRGTARLADVPFVLDESGSGILDWTLSSDHRGECMVDGIVTRLGGPPEPAGPSGDASIGPTTGLRLDHVVITTDDAMRTSEAVAGVLGSPLRRVRDAGRGVEQRFHLLDNTVVEIVSGPHVAHAGARLWGVVLAVADIDALAAHLGPDVISPPKPAVQPGRRIATVREAAGLGIPFAVMSPHSREGD